VTFGSCHIILRDPYEGTLRVTESGKLANYASRNINPKARHPFVTWIQFSCEDPTTSKTYVQRAGMRMASGGWELEPSLENVGLAEQHTTFHALKGRGWDGGGVTRDDINGDEDRRTRAFTFCIPHKRLALCGSMENAGYLMWPKETVLPQVIKLLESIEFIDTPATASSSTSAAP
jgi:hypothetical protein